MGGSAVVNILSVVVALSGMTCLYLAFFLYETEERQAQDVLERWWIVLDDTSAATAAKVRKLANAASMLLLRLINTVFGPRLISLRSIWAASWLSLATVVISADIIEVGRLARFGVALILVAIAILPPHNAPVRLLAFGCITAVLAALASVSATFVYAVISRGAKSVVNLAVEMLFGLPAAIFGIFLTLFWVAFLRWSTREFKSFESTARAATIVVLIVMLLYITIVIPPLVGANLGYWSVEYPERILWAFLPTFGLLRLGAITLIAAWPIGVYLANVVLLVAFRLTWPIVPRLLYAAQRHRILQNKQFLAKLGIAMLLASGIGPIVTLARTLSPYLQ